MDERAAYEWVGRALKPIADKVDAHQLHDIADKIATELDSLHDQLIGRGYALAIATTGAARLQDELATANHALALAAKEMLRLQDEVARLNKEKSSILDYMAATR